MDIVLISAIAWAIAQFTKLTLSYVEHRKFDWSLITSSGGFPSAHSAFVTCLVTQIGFVEGFRTSIFALAIGFWSVVIYDSFNVRRAVGIQAQTLNRIGEGFSETTGEPYIPIKEILGHTPFQVLCGILLGVFIALIRIQFLPFLFTRLPMV